MGGGVHSRPSRLSTTVAGVGLRVLVVCTGNVCRSPLVERLLAARLGGGVEVTSAGTQALVGEAMTPLTAELVQASGADATGHRARQLDEDLLGGALDLVLTATRAHRADVLRVRPVLLRRTYTVREAGRLASLLAPEVEGAAPQERLRDLVARLPSARGRWPALDAGLDDADDPYGRDRAAYARTAAQLLPAVDALAAAVRGPGSS